MDSLSQDLFFRDRRQLLRVRNCGENFNHTIIFFDSALYLFIFPRLYCSKHGQFPGVALALLWNISAKCEPNPVNLTFLDSLGQDLFLETIASFLEFKIVEKTSIIQKKFFH